jgi:amino acid adenylation domain-containing protein/non-ribosomal peptide synthase protein (TIGR01720 family)
VALGRSVAHQESVLGVLTAGAAYLPLDLTLPAARLAALVGEARPTLILTGASGRGALPATVPSLDLAAAIAGEGSDAEAVTATKVGGGQAAYVFYTSGSTGQPKGVVNTHAGLVNRLVWMQTAYALGPRDRVLQKTPLTFDVSMWETVGPWVWGATGVVLPPGDERDAAAVVTQLARAAVTTVHFVPTLLGLALAEAGAAAAGRGVRHVICSGEALPGALVAAGQTQWPQATMHNLYGPTEAAIDVTAWRCEVADGDPAGPPIGRPVWNTQTWVLDEGLTPVPAGIVGELYLGGVQLARGYLGRPALTAQRFVAAPDGQPGARAYRTGDLVRWRADGALVFVGRADQQVKLRGVRVELGEIEAALRAQPGVTAAAALVRRDGGEPQLVAYVAAPPTIDPAALRSQLSTVLPAALVPAAIVRLDRLPVTRSGKLDRAALPAPDPTQAQAPYRPPRTPTEKILVQLVGELLRVGRVGLDDNFFALGGDSIMSIQLVSRARDAGLTIRPRDIFQFQTIERLALEASDHLQADAEGDLTGPVPLMPLMHEVLARATAIDRFSQSLLIQVPPDAGTPRIAEALAALLEHHDALRLRLRPAGSSWELQVMPMHQIRTETLVRRIDTASLEPDACMELVMLEIRAAACRLVPAEGIMLQAVWFDAGEHNPGYLALVTHHFAVDGVSWRILLPELQMAWEAIAAGDKPDLGRKSTSFRRWAELLAAEALRPERVNELEHWIDTLREPAPLTEALDPARDTSALAGRWASRLPATTTDALTRTASAFHATVNELLLTGLVVAIARWRRRLAGESTAVLLDIEGHGREEIFERVSLSRTVGWFTTSYPVRLDPGRCEEDASNGASLAAVVNAVKEQLRRVPDNGLGYGLLRFLNAETAAMLGTAPGPQLRFNYQGRLDVGASAGDWALAERAALGSDSDESMPLGHPLEVNAVILPAAEGPQLMAHWTWAPRLIGETSVRALSEEWFRVLAQLTRTAASPDAVSLTPTDVSLVGLTQAEIEQLERGYRKTFPQFSSKSS